MAVSEVRYWSGTGHAATSNPTQADGEPVVLDGAAPLACRRVPSARDGEAGRRLSARESHSCGLVVVEVRRAACGQRPSAKDGSAAGSSRSRRHPRDVHSAVGVAGAGHASARTGMGQVATMSVQQRCNREQKMQDAYRGGGGHLLRPP